MEKNIKVNLLLVFNKKCKTVGILLFQQKENPNNFYSNVCLRPLHDMLVVETKVNTGQIII